MIQQQDLYWLAGLLEGEGSFIPQTEKYPVGLYLQMTDEDVVKKASILLNCKYFQCNPPSAQERNHSISYKLAVRGKTAITYLKELLPLMGQRRSAKIKECIESFKVKKKGKLTSEQIETIQALFYIGKTPKEIAYLMPVSKWRIYQLVRK